MGQWLAADRGGVRRLAAGMPPFVIDLDYNDVSLEELAVHGLTLADAYDTLLGSPKFFPDKGNRPRRRRGLLARWNMIGPGADGALLTFVIEHPDEERVAHLITGWRSPRGDRTRYDQPGGKKNRP